jgi:phosphatidylinositol-4,5-bisphosphate 3-kinase
MYYSSRDIN